ncbi:MAG: pyruvate formate lyase family protein [Candidatus Alcyoniella australis]|nr:pyruvate formate lyase family protein [Candidatus Alcyoniella australis]
MIDFPPGISERNACYKNLVLHAPYEICIERARYVTESYRATVGRHPSLRAALALQNCLEKMSIEILDCEGIVGNRTSKIVGTPIPVERGDINAVLEMDLDSLLARERQPYRIDPQDRSELFDQILPYWRKRSLRALKRRLWKENGLHFGVRLDPLSIYRRYRSLDMHTLFQMVRSPQFKLSQAPKAVEELSYNNPGMVMNVFDVQGHMVVGHRNLLPIGFREVARRAQQRLEQCRADNDTDGVAFCEAALICCDAIKNFAGRFAVLAREQAKGQGDPQRKAELLAIAQRCERVPYDPPRDFAEAVQSLWLTQVGAIVAHGMVGIFAVGRSDQYLYPYYQRDIQRGALTRRGALDIVEELLIKLSSNLLTIPFGGKNTGSELGADSNAVTVGGLGPDGNDATNELSEVFLDAVADVRALGNSFSIRIDSKSPQSWLDKTAELFSVTSGPAVFNDEVVVEALTRDGYSAAAARDYAVIGCVEPTGEGDTFGCTSGNDISLVGALEMTLNRGRLFILGRRLGPDTGDPARFESYEQLFEAFQSQVRFMIDVVARATNLKDQAYAQTLHSPFVSLSIEGCLENARDLTQGGARYNFSSISARGLGTVADSLAAIKYAVFEQRKFTMPQLLRALRNNFRDNEVMRQYLQHRVPRYGRDEDGADLIAKQIVENFCREVSAREGSRGGHFRPGFFSYGMHVLEGAMLGATANGRLAGTPISNSLSPTNGSESNGPTGVMNSLAKFDQTLIGNGCALNIKLLPAMLSTPERRLKFGALIRGYFSQGGMEAQFNVVDNATLLDAQAHPEKYIDLVVRVSGYSALFVDLGKAIQDEIISRTQFDRLG